MWFEMKTGRRLGFLVYIPGRINDEPGVPF